jgi:hypothetical protein
MPTRSGNSYLKDFEGDAARSLRIQQARRGASPVEDEETGKLVFPDDSEPVAQGSNAQRMNAADLIRGSTALDEMDSVFGSPEPGFGLGQGRASGSQVPRPSPSASSFDQWAGGESFEDRSQATEESGDSRPDSTGPRPSKREVSSAAFFEVLSSANCAFSSWLARAGIFLAMGVCARGFLARVATALFARILMAELGVAFAAPREDISAFLCMFPCAHELISVWSLAHFFNRPPGLESLARRLGVAVESRDRKGKSKLTALSLITANTVAEIKDLRSAIKVQRALLAEGTADDALGDDNVAPEIDSLLEWLSPHQLSMLTPAEKRARLMGLFGLMLDVLFS